MLKEFFAVTLTSVYHVKAGMPSAEKILGNGLPSNVPLGGQLNGGTMIAICSFLVIYYPERIDPRSSDIIFERRVEYVHPTRFGGHTSNLVALFKTREEAFSCFAFKHLCVCDPRFAHHTLAVCEAIGDDHPDFYVCKEPGICLQIFEER